MGFTSSKVIFVPIGAVLTLTCAMMLLNSDLHGQVSESAVLSNATTEKEVCCESNIPFVCI